MTGQDVIIERLIARRLEIPDVIVFRSEARHDRRGAVAPSFSRQGLRNLGVAFDVVQENRCVSPRAGTIRGFHYQLPPHAQAKLVQVLRGRILDVSVDLRRNSPSFGCHVRAELDPVAWSQVLVPAGFAHCYCTLSDDAEVLFKLDHPFAPKFARGLRWDDPDLAVDWPVSAADATVLERDLKRPRFCDLTEFYP